MISRGRNTKKKKKETIKGSLTNVVAQKMNFEGAVTFPWPEERTMYVSGYKFGYSRFKSNFSRFSNYFDNDLIEPAPSYPLHCDFASKSYF